MARNLLALAAALTIGLGGVAFAEGGCAGSVHVSTSTPTSVASADSKTPSTPIIRPKNDG